MRATKAAAVISLVAALFCTTGCTNLFAPLLSNSQSAAPTTPAAANTEIKTWQVNVTARHQINPELFTEGLEVISPAGKPWQLLVSSGLYGKSFWGIVDESGQVVKKMATASTFFAEGIAKTPTKIWLLSYQEHQALAFDPESFEQIGQADLPGQGWGMCYHAQQNVLYVSDSSATLTVRDPDTFAVKRTLQVAKDGQPLPAINELDCGQDMLRANVWPTNLLVGIDYQTGRVTHQADLSFLKQEVGATDPDDVPNGIAQLPGTDRFLLAGKRWPTLFEVTLQTR